MSVVTSSEAAAGKGSILRDDHTSALGAGATLSMIWRLAMRELRAGLGGFGVFIACIALGVGVITGVGALADALLSGFAAEGRQLPGGDIKLRRGNQGATT